MSELSIMIIVISKAWNVPMNPGKKNPQLGPLTTWASVHSGCRTNTTERRVSFSKKVIFPCSFTPTAPFSQISSSSSDSEWTIVPKYMVLPFDGAWLCIALRSCCIWSGDEIKEGYHASLKATDEAVRRGNESYEERDLFGTELESWEEEKREHFQVKAGKDTPSW